MRRQTILLACDLGSAAWLRPLTMSIGCLLLLATTSLGQGPAEAFPQVIGDLLTPPSNLPLDQLVVRQWTTDDGLPSNNLNASVVAPDGYLWVSSFEGLSRFDGQVFENYGKKQFESLNTSGFTALAPDPKGGLWAGSQGNGPWLIEDGRLMSHPSGGSNFPEILSMTTDRDGVLWVAFESGEVWRYDGAQRSPLQHPALDGGLINEVLATADGSVWIATRSQGLLRVRGDEVDTWTTADGLASNAVLCLFEASDGSLWFGHREGIHRLHNGILSSLAPIEGETVVRLLVDGYGMVWLVTPRRLMRVAADGSSLEALETVGGHTLRAISSMRFDREGSLWLTGGSEGLLQLRQGKFINYGVEQGLPLRRGNAVYEVSPGELLIGTDDGAFRVVDSWQTERFDISPLPENTKVMDFFRDRRGRLWISTYNGLLRIDGERRRLFGLDDGLPDLSVRWLREDSRGRSWIGSSAGFSRLQRDDRVVPATELGEITDDLAFGFTEAADGRLLFAARSGLLVLSAEADRELISTFDSMPGNRVFQSLVDADGVIWAATPSGLVRLQPDGRLDLVVGAEDLPVTSVFDVREDSQGFLWLSSARGVLRFDKAALTKHLDQPQDGDLPFRLFNGEDGMAEEECTGARKSYQAMDGSLWFPTLDGISGIHPQHFPTNPIGPPVLITAVEADGEAVEMTPVLRLPSSHRRFSFAFSALSFRAPDAVKVEVFLEGFDTRWGDVGRQRRISYTNLTPGEYTLKVRAANDDGVWSQEDAFLDFVLMPRFYQTPWFASLVASCLGLLVWGIYRWRIGAIKRRNYLLEADAVERSQWIEQLAAKNRELELFAYTASHDLKSPLVTIEGFLGLLEQDALAGDHERMQKDMQRIRRAIQTMGQLLDGLLEVSRIGRLEEAPVEVDLHALATQAAESLTAQIEGAGAEVEIAEDLPKVNASPSRLMQVLQNLIANAIKFRSADAPRIVIGCRRQEGALPALFVSDNGRGIGEDFHHKIFGLFDRLDPSTEGSGLGLAIVQRVIEVHGGKVWVESDGADTGSTFYFTLAAERYV